MYHAIFKVEATEDSHLTTEEQGLFCFWGRVLLQWEQSHNGCLSLNLSPPLCVCVYVCTSSFSVHKVNCLSSCNLVSEAQKFPKAWLAPSLQWKLGNSNTAISKGIINSNNAMISLLPFYLGYYMKCRPQGGSPHFSQSGHLLDEVPYSSIYNFWQVDHNNSILTIFSSSVSIKLATYHSFNSRAKNVVYRCYTVSQLSSTFIFSMSLHSNST